MGGPRDHHTKRCKPSRERQISYLYMDSLKNDTNELICKTETLPDIENKFVVTKGEREVERGKLGVWD